MASLSLRHIYKKYPGGVTAVSDFNLEIKDKEFIVFVGPSGCGKSTTLRMIAGLEEITEGELFIGDRLVNDVAPKDRKIAMVFQNYALYPHMTVFENMAFGLKLNKTPKEEIKRRVEEAARVLDITHLLDRKPKALSGGQKQRVALGRAIVRNPMVFLLDEPLSNLDAKLRASMRTELTKLHQRVGTTFIYVTHDQVEAMTMATRIVVMKDGVIQQVDTPQNLYDSPCNLFVAGFMGTPQMNFIDGILVKKGDDVYFKFAKKPVNSMTLDKVSYSFDGVNFVNDIPVMQLKDQLLRARYEGDLYIKHSFKADELPENISFVCEPMNYKSVTVNGTPVSLEASEYLDSRFLAANITSLVKLGDNEICYSIHYFQNEHVYYVLFSDVSESFRNCLNIDTEIEEVYLFGDFAVKTDKALFEAKETTFCTAYTYTGDFALAKQKDTVDPANVITDGYPFFGGTLEFATEYEYKKGAPTELTLNGRYAVAEVEVNGKPAKKMLFSNHCDLSGLLKEGKNDIIVKITNAQRNLLGPLHNREFECVSVGPKTFTGEKMWQNGEWASYLKDRYCFVRFGFDAE